MCLAAGAEHSLAVSASGQIFSWGCGSNGRLGHAQSSNRLWFWNRNEATPRLVQSFTEKAVSVSCGHMHSGTTWRNDDVLCDVNNDDDNDVRCDVVMW